MKKIFIIINSENEKGHIKENIKENNQIVSQIEIKEIPNSFEIIGNIAHLNLREKFLPFKFLIGKIILDKNPSIKTVITKTGKIDNEFRTYNMELLAGTENFEVKHKEVNINFHFDIRKVYWCSRLQGERDRLLKVIKKGSVLCDAFCGVGPLALRAAKNGVKVYANDLNPDCYICINKNIQINKIPKGVLYTFNMDAREFIRMCITQGLNQNHENNYETLFTKGEKIDHFYMNLPKDAIEFLDAFQGAFKDNEIYNNENLPIVHVYGFSNAVDYKSDLLNRVCKAFNIPQLDNKYLIDFVVIRDVSTKKHMCSISMKIPPEVAFT
jgi:tRNA (guanine37-N1)-methyltransferase